MEKKREYDGTVARIAGNLIGHLLVRGANREGESFGVPPDKADIANAVEAARAIVAEVKRTERTPGQRLNVGDRVWLPNPPWPYLSDRIGIVAKSGDVVRVVFGTISMQGPGGMTVHPDVEHSAAAEHFSRVTRDEETL